MGSLIKGRVMSISDGRCDKRALRREWGERRGLGETGFQEAWQQYSTAHCMAPPAQYNIFPIGIRHIQDGPNVGLGLVDVQ